MNVKHVDVPKYRHPLARRLHSTLIRPGNRLSVPEALAIVRACQIVETLSDMLAMHLAYCGASTTLGEINGVNYAADLVQALATDKFLARRKAEADALLDAMSFLRTRADAMTDSSDCSRTTRAQYAELIKTLDRLLS